MSRNTSKPGVSLFPFLAVLVCTMGALILLLLVTTRRIRFDAVVGDTETLAEAEADAASLDSLDALAEMPVDDSVFDVRPTPDSESIVETAEPGISLEIPAWEKPVDATKPTPSIARMELALAEKQSERETLKQRLTTLRSLIAATDTPPVDAGAEAELADLRKLEARYVAQLETADQSLEEIKDQLDRASKSAREADEILADRESSLVSLREYVDTAQQQKSAGLQKTVLEFTNSSGTTRTPVIVEVRGDQLIFQPSEIAISEDELKSFPRDDNPLLSGVFATHSYRNGKSLTAQPYVLLLVRPDGSSLFHSARVRLMSAGIHFGYELVQQDREIDSGTVDTQEAAVVQSAIRSGMDRLEEFRELNAYAAELLAGNTPKQKQGPGNEFGDSRQSTRPEVRLLPNGGIATAEEEGFGDGRFFAGDRPTEEQLVASRMAQAERSPFAAAAEESSDSFAQWGNDQSGSPGNDPGPAADEAPPESESPFSGLADTENPFALPDEVAPNPALAMLLKQQPQPAEEASSSPFAEGDQLAFLEEQETAASPEISPVQQPVVQPAAPAASAEPPRNFHFRRSHLSGNLGIATSEFPTEAPTIARAGEAFAQAPPRRRRPVSLDEVPPPENTDELLQQLDDISDPAFAADPPSAPTDWPDTDAASSHQGTRPVGPAKALPSMSVPGGTPSGNPPAALPESMVDRFLRHAEAQKWGMEPNPHLLAMLENSAAAEPQEFALPPQTAEQPAAMQPEVVDAFEAAEEPHSPGDSVVIQIMPTSIRVGGRAEVATERLTDAQAIDQTLVAYGELVSAGEIAAADQPSSKIDLRVHPLMGGLAVRLKKRFSAAGIETSDLQMMRSADSEPSYRPQVDPAAPVDVPVPQQTGQGFSL